MVPNTNRGILRLFSMSSNLAGLGLLLPFVALALVLLAVVGHVHGTPRVFFGFLTFVVFGAALSQAIMLSQTLRTGELKVSGKIVQRREAPRRFWTWTALVTVYLVFYIAAVTVFGWATLHVSA